MNRIFPEIGYSEHVDGGLVELSAGANNAGAVPHAVAILKAARSQRRSVSHGMAAEDRHNRNRSRIPEAQTDRYTAMVGRRSVQQVADKAWERLKDAALSVTVSKSGIPTSEASSSVPAVDDLAIDGRPGLPPTGIARTGIGIDAFGYDSPVPSDAQIVDISCVLAQRDGAVARSAEEVVIHLDENNLRLL